MTTVPLRTILFPNCCTLETFRNHAVTTASTFQQRSFWSAFATAPDSATGAHPVRLPASNWVVPRLPLLERPLTLAESPTEVN